MLCAAGALEAVFAVVVTAMSTGSFRKQVVALCSRHAHFSRFLSTYMSYSLNSLKGVI